MPSDQAHILTTEGLQALLALLVRQSHRLIGPTIQDGAIVYDDIGGLDDLPQGAGDEQDGGHYRLVARQDGAYFGFAVGPTSWKKFLHPPLLRLLKGHTGHQSGASVVSENDRAERLAFVGVRACEIAAIAIQDRVLIGGAHIDVHYAKRRNGLFIIAVNCGTAGGTCFCSSMQAGPRASGGYDLALTEIIDDGGHRFLVETGSDAGRAALADVAHRPAETGEVAAAQEISARVAASMGREMPGDLHALLMHNLDHPRWDEVAERCLTCGNCTMVCPTCFCTAVEESSDLAGVEAERSRRWDSCFTVDYSHLHGGSVRTSAKSRYRQWMTHKLATWHDQFGTSGCVGCGRCITWCPVGIDITAEANAIRAASIQAAR